MKMVIGLVALFGIIAYSAPAVTVDYSPVATMALYVHASSAEAYEPAPVATTTTDIEALVRTVQATYGLGNSFYKTLRCESAGWQNIQSLVPNPSGPSGREDSWGVAQINLPSHTEVTKAQALDPAFAVDWAAQQFKAGNAWWWTCYRELR